jgi:hypothetical protein
VKEIYLEQLKLLYFLAYREIGINPNKGSTYRLLEMMESASRVVLQVTELKAFQSPPSLSVITHLHGTLYNLLHLLL